MFITSHASYIITLQPGLSVSTPNNNPMPLRRRRKRRPKRRGRTSRRKSTMMRRRKRRPRGNVLRLTRQIIPKRAFTTCKFVRYIRIPQRITNDTPPTVVNADFRMPPMGLPQGSPIGEQNTYPNNALLISCNDPMAPFNQTGTLVGVGTGWPGPDTRAFLSVPSSVAAQPPPTESQALFDTHPLAGGGVPPSGAPTGYTNEFPSFWRKMENFYRRWTVVGSKATVSFSPDPVYSAIYARQASKHCIFTMGVRGSRADLDLAAQPQSLTEQPGFITREYNGRRQTDGRCYALSMTRKWSARKGFGLSKGDIVSNGEITGTTLARPDERLHGFRSPNQVLQGNTLNEAQSAHPHSQQYFQWAGNSILTNNTEPGAYEPTEWPSGVIKVVLNYSTVWSSPQFTDNEFD